MSESLPVPISEAKKLPVIWRYDGFAAQFDPHADLSDADMVDTIAAISGAQERLPLANGDLINECVNQWMARGMKKSDCFDQLAHATGYSAGYLRNQAYAAKRIHPSRRREGIKPALYQEIADEKDPHEQEMWMDRILGEDLRRKDVRAIKRAKAEEDARAMPTTDGKAPVTMAECPTCHSIVPETALYGQET